MKRTIYFLVAILGVFLSIVGRAQFIQRLEVEPTIGVSRVDLEMFQSGNPDFMNHLSQEDIFIDDAHAGLLLRFGLVKNWEINLLMERHLEFVPILWNIHVSKKFLNNWGVSLGLSKESFIIGSLDQEYNYLNNRFLYETKYYLESNPFYIKSFLICPFLGLNYSQNAGRFNFRYSINSGLAINNPLNRYMMFKEIESNYVFTDNYEIPSNATVFLKPEVYTCYKLIDNKNIVLGLRLKLSNYITQKDLDYTKTHNEWTGENPIIETVDLPKHWLNCLSFDVGLLYQKK